MVSEQIDRDFVGNPFKNNVNGYWYVKVGTSLKSLHRYLAEKHIPNPDNYTDVNHIDGNKDNNSVSNLEWCSRSQNIKHAYANNLRIGAWTGKNGSKHPRSEPVLGIHIETGVMVEFESIGLTKEAGFTPSSVCEAVSGKRRSHKGYTWFKVLT